jgi:hypothetical protein
VTERVDWDRLADYVGGVLDGAPEADAVRELIAVDADWAAAYTDLVAADAAVKADLAGYAESPAPMPSAVAQRIDAFLSTLDAPASAGAAPRSGRSSSGPRSERADSTGPGRAARRRRFAGISALAGVMVFVAGLLWVVPQLGISRKDAGGSAQSAADAPAGAPLQNAPVELASGRNYAPEDFAALADTASGEVSNEGGAPRAGAQATPVNPESNKAAANPPGADADAFGPVPDELIALKSPVQRQACLDAIHGRYGGVPTLLDYARFRGRPALVVVLDRANVFDLANAAGGRQWVVVVGPACGSPPGSLDERYNGPAA